MVPDEDIKNSKINRTVNYEETMGILLQGCGFVRSSWLSWVLAVVGSSVIKVVDVGGSWGFLVSVHTRVLSLSLL
ncbi:hypothetical protein L484_021601 [Morus notabilis]|uniref:Uncharacterized protein n=1 Tax=Morus notabilis TaxID=981085 RepID=W9RXR8_9ROSA|nr:hypothetical protein L484_021601 [Morus notabilis]